MPPNGGIMKDLGTLFKLTALAALFTVSACTETTSSSNAITPSLSSNDSFPNAQLAMNQYWTKTPIAFYLSDTIPESLRESILNSFELWETKAGIRLFEFKGYHSSRSPSFDGKNVVYWNNEPNSDGKLGMTYRKVQGNTRVVEADIMFFGNPERYASLSCGENSRDDVCHVRENKFDITTLALHEIGHLIGFDHVEGSSVMNPNFGLSDVHQDLEEDLLSVVDDTYGTGDSLAWNQ